MNAASAHITTIALAFFAMMNPIANASVFVGLTDGMSERDRRMTAIRAVLLSLAVVALFTVAGKWILEIFGVTIDAFRIAGGVLVAMVGFHLLQGEPSRVHATTVEDNARSRNAALDIWVTPLAMPVLAGPGTLTTAMSYAADGSFDAIVRVLAAFIFICAITLAAFLSGPALVRVLGRNAIKVVTRIMGLILAVIGTQMVISGVRGAMGATGS